MVLEQKHAEALKGQLGRVPTHHRPQAHTGRMPSPGIQSNAGDNCMQPTQSAHTLIHGHAQSCTVMHGHAQSCTVMHGQPTRPCTVMHGHARSAYRAMHSHARSCTVSLQGHAQSCTVMHSQPTGSAHALVHGHSWSYTALQGHAPSCTVSTHRQPIRLHMVKHSQKLSYTVSPHGLCSTPLYCASTAYQSSKGGKRSLGSPSAQDLPITWETSPVSIKKSASTKSPYNSSPASKSTLHKVPLPQYMSVCVELMLACGVPRSATDSHLQVLNGSTEVRVEVRRRGVWAHKR